MVNNMGPRTEPWGTPQERGDGLDLLLAIETHCERSERYNLNHMREGPVTPRQLCMRSRRMSWDTKSKAAEQSRRLSRTGLWSSRALSKSSMTAMRAVSVE